MRGRRLLPLAVGAALLLGACASDDPAEVELKLPTQAESDAVAAKRIHENNADAEMKKLEEEIAGDEKP